MAIRPHGAPYRRQAARRTTCGFLFFTKEVVSIKRIKYLLTAALLFLSIGLLSGCDQIQPEPELTPRQLIQSIKPLDTDLYYDMTIAMTIVETKNNDQRHVITMSTGIEGRRKITHMYDARFSFRPDKSNADVAMETWLDMGNKIVYTCLNIGGESTGWVKQSLDLFTLTPVDSLTELVNGIPNLTENADKITLEPRDNNDDYVITWPVGSDQLADFIGDLGSLGGSEFNAGELISGTITATLDAETRDIKSVTTSAQAQHANIELNITFLARNRENIHTAPVIPSEIIAETAD